MAQGIAALLQQAQQRRENEQRLTQALNKAQDSPTIVVTAPKRETPWTQPALKRETQVQTPDYYRAWTGTPRLESQQDPIYSPEDSGALSRASDTVGYMGDTPKVYVRPANTVPKPPTMPQVTPVAPLKNHTALKNQNTP